MTIRKWWGALAVALAALLAVAGISATSATAADPVLTRASFTPTTTWAWTNDASLGTTASGAQYAQANIAGLTDKDHAAGFRVRYSASSNILLAVSGTEWKTEPSGGTVVNGPHAQSASGLLRVEIDASNNAKILWNGIVIGTRAIPGTYTGTGVVASAWQSTATVKMTNLEAGTLGTAPTPTGTPVSTATVTVTPTVTASPVTSTAPAVTVTSGVPTTTVTAPPVTVTPTVTITPTVTVTPSTSPTSPSPTTTSPSPSPSTTSPSPSPTGAATWLSGASSIYAVNGTFGTWRGEPVKIVGTWSDSKDCSATVCSMGGDLSGLHGPDIALDIAVGGIWNGQNWASAATGAYDSQWQSTLTSLKNVLTSRGMDPAKVYIRFAHEMNGDWTEWDVNAGQEANFRAAITRFSNLRYSTFGSVTPKVVLCANDGSSGGEANPHNLFVARDVSNRPVVDVYCIDTYNQYPHRTDDTAIWSAFNNTSDESSIESSRAFAQSVGVPFSIGEWGNCGIAADCAGGGGESPAYVRQMNRYFRAHAGTGPGNLLYEVQFNLWPRFALYGSEANQPATSAEYVNQVWGQ